MKILQICIWKKGSGITRHVENILKNVPENEYEIVTYKTKRFRWIFLIIFGLAKNVSQYDLIHAHYIFPQGFLGFLYKILYRKPLILTIHGSDYLLLKKFPILKFILKHSNLILTVSEFLKKEISKYVCPEKVKVVYNCVEYYSKESRKEDSIAYIGSITRIKSVGELVKEFSSRNLKYTLYIVGEGPEVRKLKRFSNESVKFLGFVEDIGKVLSKVKFLILPSKFEGFGIVLLEAMQYNVLPIARNVGGIRDVILNGYNGILFEKDLGKVLENLERYEYLRVKLIKNFKKTLKKFSCKKFSKRIRKVYNFLFTN